MRCAQPQKFSDRSEVVASDKNPTESDVGEVQRASRYDLVRALAPRYAHVGKLEKGQLLDEVCQVTGYTRKHAVALLKHPPPDEPVVKRTRHRSANYGPAEVELLQLCWLVTDGICGKRLAPFLPELLRRLRHWHALRDVPAEVQARVAQMSAATVDRALRPYRTREGRRGISTTRPGALLKRQIAIRTFSDWTDVQPGFLEMDLVAHCGWNAAGQFLYTLSMVDVATGWVACAGLRDRRQETVFSGLQRLQADLPFPILGLDSDNGGEFINRLLIGYCAEQGITFTRGRPYAKNDSCHIEQKNWAVVRRLVGYDRLELPALAALERIHDLARDYVNFLHPVRKLVSKTRDGARVHRRYDAARTPYLRLVDSGVLSTQMTRELKARSANVDPVRLKVHLEAAQRTLPARAARSDPYVRQS